MLFGDLLQEVYAVFTKKRTWEVFKLSRKSKRSKETIRQIRLVKAVTRSIEIPAAMPEPKWDISELQRF